MYITDIFIEEFGGVTDKSIKLQKGFNLLTGENESGKSTICAFIKFVFYGFSTTKEKERYSSLKTGISAGYIIIEKDEMRYRIERREVGSVKSVSVYNEETSTELNDWKSKSGTPGEYFLGVPQELYVRSLYVSQDGGAKLDGGSAEAVSNLLLSGDEALNLKRAQKNLDQARKTLKYKKGVGGRIYELSERIEVLKSEKARGIELKKEIHKLTCELSDTEKEILSVQEKIKSAKAAVLKAKNAKILIYLDEQNRVKDAISQSDEQMSKLKKEYTCNGYLPSDDFESKIISAERDVRTYLEQCTNLQNQLDRVRNDLSLTPPKGYEGYCALGKRDAVLAESKRYQSSIGMFKVFVFAAVFVLLMTVIAGVATLVGVLNDSALLLIALIIVSVVVAALAIALGYFPKKNLKKLYAAIGADQKRTPEMVCEECKRYEDAISTQSKYLVEAIQQTRNRLFERKNEEKQLLAKWGKSSVSQALADYKAYSSSYAQLRKDRETLETRMSVVEAYLSYYSDQEIAQARKSNKNQPLSQELKGMTEENIAQLEISLSELQNRRNALNLEIASRGADKIDLQALSAEIEQTETALAADNEKLEAIMLAISALDQAENNIRRTVSPYLSERSSELFEKITNGRYPELRLDPEMNLSYLGQGGTMVMDSAYLSVGSADLAWLCLRLALHSRLAESEAIPIILDECLVYFDDQRLGAILERLYEISDKGIQILMLSASNREKDRIGDRVNLIQL